MKYLVTISTIKHDKFNLLANYSFKLRLREAVRKILAEEFEVTPKDFVVEQLTTAKDID